MEESEVQYDLTYLQKEPDVGTLRHAFSRTSSDLSSYIQMCRASYDDRRNWWVGKSQVPTQMAETLLDSGNAIIL